MQTLTPAARCAPPQEYPNVLTLRVRMPIVQDLQYPRNFITKIIKYDKVREGGAGPLHL